MCSQWGTVCHHVELGVSRFIPSTAWRPLLNPVNNLVYSATGASVRPMLIDGRMVLDDGRLTTLDEPALYERAEVLARQQIARAGLAIVSKWPEAC